jgi:hypothetical protein
MVRATAKPSKAAMRLSYDGYLVCINDTQGTSEQPVGRRPLSM